MSTVPICGNDNKKASDADVFREVLERNTTLLKTPACEASATFACLKPGELTILQYVVLSILAFK